MHRPSLIWLLLQMLLLRPQVPMAPTVPTVVLEAKVPREIKGNKVQSATKVQRGLLERLENRRQNRVVLE